VKFSFATASLLAAALAAVGTAAPSVAAPGHEQSNAQLIEQEKRNVEIYKAYFPSTELARKAAISFHGQLLESNYAGGYLVLELDGDDITKLQAFGVRFERATDFIERRNQMLTQLQSLAASRTTGTNTSGTNTTGTNAVGANAVIQSIPSFSCYETVEETFAAADGLIAAKPTLGSWVDAGDSWLKTQGAGGYDMRVLKLTNSAVAGAGGSKPKLFVNSAIHAREYTTAPLVLEFARWLVNGHGSNADATWILDHHEVHLMLHTNPDGRKRAEGGLSWRKNVNNNFCANTNTRGIDLNRNFTYSWNSTNGQGSSGDQCNLTYRGPSAGSEPETQAVQSYVRSLWPDRRGPLQTDAAPADTSGIHLDIHSYSQLVLWPWGTTSTPAPNGTALQTLGRKFAFFNGYTPQQAIGLYPTDGTSDSVSYGELGVAAYTIELGTAFFESCTNYNNTIKPNNLPALIYAAKVVRTPYITPGGPDVSTLTLGGGASAGGVTAGTAVALSASATDTRFNNSNGAEPTQAIAGAEAYIDLPPWQAGATAVALTASDGAFDATTESIGGSLNTSGLSVGPHIVYVRALDAGGTWGAVSAVFLNITNTLPTLNAAFSANCSALSCSFDASASSGGATSYQWDFGDGSSASGVTASRSYAAAGSFNVTLTVSNGTASDSETQVVTVSAGATPITETGANNNSTGTAQLISANPATISGTISSSRDTDYYRVTLAPGKTLTAVLTPNSTSDYDLYIRNAGGSIIARSELATGVVERATAFNSGATAITLYVQVTRFSGGTGATSGRYTLTLAQ
jgi:carboxypeptidase T